jgi:hypothetical protein
VPHIALVCCRYRALLCDAAHYVGLLYCRYDARSLPCRTLLATSWRCCATRGTAKRYYELRFCQCRTWNSVSLPSFALLDWRYAALLGASLHRASVQCLTGITVLCPDWPGSPLPCNAWLPLRSGAMPVRCCDLPCDTASALSLIVTLHFKASIASSIRLR